VCCEKLNKVNHKRVDCPFCDLTSCRSCSQRYILSSFEDPHCMGCKTTWNREFIDSFCTGIFRNRDLKNHRENVLLEREKALMPSTQPEVERILKIKRMHRIIREQKENLIFLHNRYEISGVDEVGEQIRALYDVMERTHRELARLRNMSGYTVTKTFTRQCPLEVCKGFLNEDWYCGLCERQFCRDCNELLTDTHECDPGVVETMKLLNRDSKSCPKCGMVIHKLNGCSQMWCIGCHTAFDWRTGEIVTGRVHNPHYIEFRRNGMLSREHGDIPCGGIPSFGELRENQAPEKFLQYLTVIQTMDNENLFMVDPPPIDNIRARISYMLNYLNDDIFKDFLQRQEKHREKMREMSSIYEVLIHSGGDFLRQFIIEPRRREEIEHQLGTLFEYGNGIFENIRRRYVSVAPKNITI
jgi:hypothetical protein